MKKQHDDRSLERRLFYIGLAALPASVLIYRLCLSVFRHFWPFRGCIWDVVFGIYCPGCGGTRAIEALLNGKLLTSFWFQPVVGYSIFLYFSFMISQLLSLVSKGRIRGMKFHNWYLYVALMIIVVNCLFKNYLRLRHGITL